MSDTQGYTYDTEWGDGGISQLKGTTVLVQ